MMDDTRSVAAKWSMSRGKRGCIVARVFAITLNLGLILFALDRLANGRPDTGQLILAALFVPWTYFQIRLLSEDFDLFERKIRHDH